MVKLKNEKYCISRQAYDKMCCRPPPLHPPHPDAPKHCTIFMWPSPTHLISNYRLETEQL